MSVKLTAEIRILGIDEKEPDKDAILLIEDDEEGGINLVIESKELTITVDKDDLLEAVARVAGGDIRIAKEA